MEASPRFPNLSPTNHTETSPATPRYNCVARAAEDTARWWQPGSYWLPSDWPAEDYGFAALEQAFRERGYEDAAGDETLEPGVRKVAHSGSGFLYTHAARQLPTGKWTSKRGKGVDIEHDSPSVVAGGLYGDVVRVMRRRIV